MKKITDTVAEELQKLGFTPKGTPQKKRKKGESFTKLSAKVSQEKISGKTLEKDVDKLSTLAEIFSAAGPKNVDNLIKYEVLIEVIHNQNVFHSPSEFTLLITLMALEFTRGVINVSQAELSAITGLSERSIRKILKDLSYKGLIEVDRIRNAKSGENYTYKLVYRKIFPLCCSSLYINKNNYNNITANFRWKNFPSENFSADNYKSQHYDVGIIKGEGKFKSIRIDTLIKEYGLDRVYYVMDMLNHKYADRNVAHPYKLIKSVLDNSNIVHNKFYHQFRGRKNGEEVDIYVECPSCTHRGIVKLRVGEKHQVPCSKCSAVVEVDLNVNFS
ncbi:MAG: helix-turn-helix domain-containing protein [candidate division WOR-3 bacterium]